ncbi:MAG: ABC transporter, ATP-binding protein 1 (cluster 4, leucine/isoleucine/valine/benzoate) [uncultured Ramlibacter sp.]|uniref:ABC transporter, ATP-binding protein 1 (Cluster 4, leucine/isoleucine/valine/benzoate) n=1 Tax=uncultured Ramlibacter sp. TaxID=260755 RepID=A0A6J4NFH7_9BURK|nr:MAG: ABC transporter, ATP-binding protein 1 (cluster 4, leucine/isoleucine/valine/benzoate) [uncultured Ramlibacter sp.]
MTAALSLANVCKAFGGLRAVDDVTFDVQPGERRVLIGPNGAGKTSLFHCISGALLPTSGRITCFGEDVTRLAEHKRTALGVGRTFQISSVFNELTVFENLAAASLGVTAAKWSWWRPVGSMPGVAERAKEELQRVGLAGLEGQLVKHLSYGQRRQLELALALINRPRLLLLDEPCAGLSPAERVRLSGIVRALPPSITMVMIEHDMDVALRLADRVSVLHRGRIILEGTSSEVSANPQVREVYFGQV